MNNNVGLLHVRVPQITAKAVDAVRLGVLLRRTGVQTAQSLLAHSAFQIGMLWNIPDLH